MNRIYIDSFSGSAAELPRKHRDAEHVLAALRRDPRLSVWDLSEHRWLEVIVRDLIREGVIRDTGSPYPWVVYEFLETSTGGEG